MARYGKTLRDEARTSGGAEEDLLIGGQTREADTGKRLRSFAAYIVLVFSLGLFYSERWISAVVLLVVFVVLLIVNAPSRGAFYQDDNSSRPTRKVVSVAADRYVSN